jgi:hypothetical protein
MPGFELRIWPIPFGDVARPLAIERFEADSEAAAVDRMFEFARTLDRDKQVYLYADGVRRSIAGEDGLA